MEDFGPFGWTEPPVEPTATEHSSVVASQLDHPFLHRLKVEGGTEEGLPTEESGLIAKTVSTTNGLVRLHTVLGDTKYAIAYAEVNIISDRDQDSVLLAESDDGIKAWLNGALIVNVAAIRSITQFMQYVPIHLKKGGNQLLLKLVRTKQPSIWDPWDFAIGLRSRVGAIDEMSGRGEAFFLPSLLVKQETPLDLDLGLLSTDERVTLTLTQNAKERHFDFSGGVKTQVSLDGFSLGPIQTVLQIGTYKFTEPILYGWVDDFAKKYRDDLTQCFNDPRNKANLGVLLTRFEFLLDPSVRNNDNREWQQKLARLVAQIEQIVGDIRAAHEPYQGKSGTWLRGFTSKIDGELQYYVVHAPPQSEGQHRPLPLVIELPYEVFPLRTYLHRIYPPRDLDVHDRAADANGFAYLLLDNRGNSYGQDFGLTDLFTALEEVEHDYSIDKDRIYLYGGCSGALHALSLASAHPDLFAAVGGASAISRYNRVTIFDRPSPSDQYACRWLKGRSPVEHTDNLLNVPVFLLHGDEDTHTPISESMALDAAAHSTGAPFTFSVAHGGTRVRWPVDRLYPMFSFFNGKSRVQGPAHFVYSTSSPKKREAYWARIDSFTDPLLPTRIEGRLAADGSIAVQTQNVQSYSILLNKLGRSYDSVVVATNGKPSFSGHPNGNELAVVVEKGEPDLKSSILPGPMSEAFSGPFLLVAGTQGEGAAAAAAQEKAFEESWQARYFTNPRKKLDSEVTDADIHDFNLVLFGTSESNKVLNRIAVKLPVRYDATGVSVGGRTWSGTGYSVQAAFPNPLDNKRYVVLVGDPACKHCPANALQFTLHAWYDAAIWKQNEAGQVRLVSVGSFDGSWAKYVEAQSCR